MGEVAERYGLNERGNFSDEATGIPIPKNILHLQAVAPRHPALDRLMAESEARVRPFVDDKRIFGLNGLMISALSRAGYLDLATKCASNWLKITEDALCHQIGSTSPPFLDDIAYFADALLDLYTETSDPKWLEAAESLADRMIEYFSCESGGFYFTSSMHEKLYSRTIPAMDNAMPSPNGVAVRVLRRLGRQEESLTHLTAIYGWAQRLPGASSTILLECLEQLLLAEGELRLDGAKNQPRAEIEFDPREVIVGEDGFGYSKVIIRIPNGLHINSHSPGAHWLTPTTVRIEGVYGEAGFPDPENDRYEGEVEIHLRLKAKTRTDEFELSVTYQICSDSECYLAQEARFAGVLITPGD
ncbi:MAG: protein-disulfide reductase DsbD family protein [Fimbriimonadaceae bacterium]